MKWLIFTSAVVVALVTLGILAVDERDVVWEGRTALCGYCRAELPNNAVVCANCDRSLDWRTAKEECRWCLDITDIEHLLGLYRDLVPEDAPLPASLAKYGRAYFDAIDVGACTYCGGLGKIVDGEGKEVCPVCRGTKRCIACAGSRSVVLGDEGARRRALEREDAHERARQRAETADLPVNEQMLVDEDVAALRGYLEAEELKDEAGRNLLQLGRERLAGAFRTLHDEKEHRGAAAAGSTGGS